ncbi:hypothetical protein DPM13_01440 [Paracoccus mutanolyticus]|uniref:Uncharacterized protein n=1 Tax=Paracoccus mutanolyticus TaxID=1499308 RepID=A0ABN5M9A1_9RHOB|nr:hypothetical protein DPM13_01440 [Paracoccus mutanolyticus]
MNVEDLRKTPEGYFTTRWGLPEYTDWIDEGMSCQAQRHVRYERRTAVAKNRRSPDRGHMRAVSWRTENSSAISGRSVETRVRY